MRVDSRWIDSASWYVASELARRHDGYRIVQVHTSGGQSDRLWIGKWQPNPLPHDETWSALVFRETWSLNRWLGGAAHVNLASSHGDEGPAAAIEEWWHDFYAAEDPHQLVERLEEMAGLTPTPGSRPTTPTTLTYRVIARLLALTADARLPLTCRNLFIDSSDGGGSGIPKPQRFARVLTGTERLADGPVTPETYAYWLIERGGDCVALLREDGNAWSGQDEQQRDLMTLYRGPRRLWAVLAGAFPDLLP